MAVGIMTHAWALAYPLITGTTAACGFILAVHGVYRLVWRWWHGLPILFDPKWETPRDRPRPE